MRKYLKSLLEGMIYEILLCSIIIALGIFKQPSYNPYHRSRAGNKLSQKIYSIISLRKTPIKPTTDINNTNLIDIIFQQNTCKGPTSIISTINARLIQQN